MSTSKAEIEAMTDLVHAAMEGQLHMEQVDPIGVFTYTVKASVNIQAVAERLLLRGVRLP